MTLKPISEGADPLNELARWNGTDATERMTGLRDAFYGSLPWEPQDRPFHSAASSGRASVTGRAAAARWWSYLQQLADERSLRHYRAQLANLENQAAGRQARASGEYAILAVRAVQFSVLADLATAKARTSLAREMVREVSPSTLNTLPRLPDVPSAKASGDAIAGTQQHWQHWYAEHLEAASAAVTANEAAVEAVQSQWHGANRPVEDVLEALAASRQAQANWLAAITRYQSSLEL